MVDLRCVEGKGGGCGGGLTVEVVMALWHIEGEDGGGSDGDRTMEVMGDLRFVEGEGDGGDDGLTVEILVEVVVIIVIKFYQGHNMGSLDF